MRYDSALQQQQVCLSACLGMRSVRSRSCRRVEPRLCTPPRLSHDSFKAGGESRSYSSFGLYFESCGRHCLAPVMVIQSTDILQRRRKVWKPVVPLLKRESLGKQFSESSKVKSAKSGGAMAPLAPLLTTALLCVSEIGRQGQYCS